MVRRAQALAITPIMFLNLVSLVIFWVLSFFAATERAKARLWQNQFMSYGSKARPGARPRPPRSGAMRRRAPALCMGRQRQSWRGAGRGPCVARVGSPVPMQP